MQKPGDPFLRAFCIACSRNQSKLVQYTIIRMLSAFAKANPITMRNPILSSKSKIIYYILIWLAMAGVQMGAAWFWWPAPWFTWLSDSLLMHSLYALSGLGIWYVVRYNSPELRNFWNLITTHMIAAALLTMAWVMAGQWLLKLVFGSQEQYIAMLPEVFPWRFVFGVFYYILLVVLYYLLLYQERFREKTLREGQLEAMVKEAELSMLKLQINPHFIFNSLNSIASLTIIDPEKARHMIIALSDFLRYSLQADEQPLVSLKSELENMERYLEVERIRFEDLLELKIDVEDAAQRLRLPLLLTQPLVENAIKHGVYEATDPVRLHISAKAEEENLIIKICNDITGPAGTKKGQGIGLQNIRDRLRLLYNRTDCLVIDKTENTFTVTLTIPQDVA